MFLLVLQTCTVCICINSLKPMDSFGTWRILKWIFFLVNAEFYRVECPVNSSLRNASIFRKYPKHQNVRSPPEHIAIGYVVHNAILPRGNITLQYVIQNNCRKVWWRFLMISLHFSEDQDIFLVKFTKTILWL